MNATQRPGSIARHPWRMLLLAGGLCLAACDDNPAGLAPVTASQANWLTACSTDDDCASNDGAALECLCGVCTATCQTRAGCAEIGTAATCVQTRGGANCGAEVPAQICSLACTASADCGHPALECISGACLPILSDGGPVMRTPDASTIVPDAAVVAADAAADSAVVAADAVVVVVDAVVAADASADAVVAADASADAVVAADAAADAVVAADAAADSAVVVAADAAADAVVVADAAAADGAVAVPEPRRNACPGAQGCCADAECADDAICQAMGFNAQNAYCGGIAPQEVNECQIQGCAADADCGQGMACMLAGQHGFVRNACVTATCRVDADCVGEGGECTPFFTPCNNAGFQCTFAADPCRIDDDCPGLDMLCSPVQGGGTACRQNQPAP